MDCPGCGDPNAYIGFVSVECPRYDCMHFHPDMVASCPSTAEALARLKDAFVEDGTPSRIETDYHMNLSQTCPQNQYLRIYPRSEHYTGDGQEMSVLQYIQHMLNKLGLYGYIHNPEAYEPCIYGIQEHT